MKNDDELKRLFQQERMRDARRIPSFDGLLQPRRRAPEGLMRFSLATAAAMTTLVLAIGSWWLLPLSPTAPDAEARPPGDLVATSWSTPSDFLLEVPGQELLGTPSLIAIDGWTLLDGTNGAGTGSHTDSMEATGRQPPPKLTI